MITHFSVRWNHGLATHSRVRQKSTKAFRENQLVIRNLRLNTIFCKLCYTSFTSVKFDKLMYLCICIYSPFPPQCQLFNIYHHTTGSRIHYSGVITWIFTKRQGGIVCQYRNDTAAITHSKRHGRDQNPSYSQGHWLSRRTQSGFPGPLHLTKNGGFGQNAREVKGKGWDREPTARQEAAYGQ